MSPISSAPPSARPEPSVVAVVDDDPLIRRTIRLWLEHEGYEVQEFATAGDILSAHVGSFAAVCLDLALGDADGIDVLKHIRAVQPDLPVLLITAQQALSSVVRAMRAGAHDYVTKPLEMERVVLSVRNAIEHSTLTRRVWALRRQIDEARVPHKLVGQSPAMRGLVATIQRVLDSEVAVCILGESGTGKELVARAIHEEGRRKRGPFVAINCAAIPENLQESELFGHERGAFTGASSSHRGRFEQAEGGTIFLDELGDMSPSTQVKLLRALQEKAIRRVGGTADLRTNVRVLCATHKNIEEEVKKGRFREDLYFRLMVYPIEVPPLRERHGDVPLLVAHFLKVFREDVGRDVTRIAPEALDALQSHSWPGNVRELENVMHRAMLSSTTDRIELSDLPPALRMASLPKMALARSTPVPDAARVDAGEGSALLPTLVLRDLEALAIKLALRETKGHIANAARLLGMGRATLYRRLVETGDKVDEPPSSPDHHAA
jgi:DNA-binding NtrC family response regulator